MSSKSLCSILGNTIFSQLGHDCIPEREIDSISLLETAAEQINQVIRKQYDAIASQITFSQKSLLKAHYIAEAMLALGDAAEKRQDYEVSMFMLSRSSRNITDGLYIDDVVVGKKQIVHPALCNVSSEGSHLSEEDAADSNMCILGWAHSHARMPVFYSGTDDRQLEHLANYKAWPVGLDVFDEGKPSIYAHLYPALVVNGQQANPSVRIRGCIPFFSVVDGNLQVDERIIDYEQKAKELSTSTARPQLVISDDESTLDESTRREIQQDLREQVTFNDGTQLKDVVDEYIDIPFCKPTYFDSSLALQQNSQANHYDTNHTTQFSPLLHQRRVRDEFVKRYGEISSQKKSYAQQVGQQYLTCLDNDPFETSITTKVSGILSGLPRLDGSRQWKWKERNSSLDEILNSSHNCESMEESRTLIELSSYVLQHQYLRKTNSKLQSHIVNTLVKLSRSYTYASEASA